MKKTHASSFADNLRPAFKHNTSEKGRCAIRSPTPERWGAAVDERASPRNKHTLRLDFAAASCLSYARLARLAAGLHYAVKNQRYCEERNKERSALDFQIT